MLNKFGLIIHGGAGEENTFVKNNIYEIEKGLHEALLRGYEILNRGMSALKAVEEAVIILENNPYFNAGRGSALNSDGEIEMDAAIMDGKTVKAGAVSMVRYVRNPIVLARTVMKKTKHVFLSGYGALKFAESNNIILEPETYFMTSHQYEDYLKYTEYKKTRKKSHGTVGAVALDQKGNLAAATSTGGTSYCLPGRIGDSCVIGAGCYANNATCAVSGTGEGEVLINNVIAHTVSMMIELQNLNLQKACDYVLFRRPMPVKGEIGIISINQKGEMGISFNCDLMKRAWKFSDGNTQIKIYK